MLNLAKENLNDICPTCKNIFTYSLEQIASEETITCVCGQELKLKDEGKGIWKVMEIDRKLDQNLKSLMSDFESR